MAFSGGSGRGKQTFSEINITPLTDVFLVLLIIMILIAPLINQGALKVEPPIAQHGKSDGKQDKTIVIEVSQEGTIAVNNNKVVTPATPIEDIEKIVGEAIRTQFDKYGSEEVPVAVRADGEARQKYVVAVLDAAAGNKVKKLKIVTTKK